MKIQNNACMSILILTTTIPLFAAEQTNFNKALDYRETSEAFSNLTDKTHVLLQSAHDLAVKVSEQAHTLINNAESFIEQKSTELSSAITNITNNASFNALQDALQKQFSMQWGYTEITRILLLRGFNLWELKELNTFITNNQELCAKLIPASCTLSAHFSQQLLSKNNAPSYVLNSINNLCEYGKENGFITSCSQDIMQEKSALITEILVTIDYLSFRDMLKFYITNVKMIKQFIPQSLHDEDITQCLDKALYESLAGTFSTAELIIIKDLFKSNLGKKFKNPQIYVDILGKMLSRLQDGSFDTNLISLLEPQAQEITKFINNNLPNAATR